MKRIFFAVPISEEVRNLLNDIQSDMRDLPGKIRWVPPEDVHLTIKFIGEVEEEVATNLQSQVDDLSLPERFSITVNRTGVFPHPRRPRVLWVGTEDSTSLEQIATQLDAAFEEYGIEPETREFHPHLTLGRVKGRGLPGETLNQFLNYEVPKISMPVESVVCYESVLKSSGAEYTALHTTHLQ